VITELCIWCNHAAIDHVLLAGKTPTCVRGCDCRFYEGVTRVKSNLNTLLKSFPTVDIDEPIALQAERQIRNAREREKREYELVAKIARAFNWRSDFGGVDELSLTEISSTLITEIEKLKAPISMLLWCPACGERHIDSGEFATKRHHTHACQSCGVVWRPALVDTVGVQFLPGFKNP
jgi:predicted RNA-binding Zn-ribbon protein involved in translation (DUF1610 family)